jgi:hypothetical protein
MKKPSKPNKPNKRKPHTWGSIYRNALARGEDHGYAAFLADAWEARGLTFFKKSTLG